MKGVKKVKNRPYFVKSNTTVTAVVELSRSMALDTFKNNPQLGRFSLRDEGKTIGIGRIIKMIE